MVNKSPNSIRIALGQMHCCVGVDDETLTSNQNSITSCYEKAKNENCDVVVLPELSICGYSPEDAMLRKDVQEKITQAGNSIVETVLSKGQDSPALLFGSPRLVDPLDDKETEYPQKLRSLTSLLLRDKALANAIVIVDPNKSASHEVYKKDLPNWGVFDEGRWFAAASTVADPVEIKGAKVGVLNCRDIWIQQNVSDLVDRGAQVIIVPNASPYANSRHKERIATVSRYANAYSIPIVYVNMIQGCDEGIFDGGSFAVDAQGNIIAEAKRFETDFVVVDVEIPESTNHNVSESVYADVSSKLTTDVCDPNEAYRAVVLGVKEFFNAINSNSKVVVGLSGGVDSALVATIAVDALGADRVHGVLMPSRFTSKASIDDANELVERLGITSELISIEKLHESASQELDLDSLESTVGENIQARIRGMILMMLSNSRGLLPLATSNKTESAIGYCTLYGDTVGAYSPIKDVYKLEVYDFCAWRNERGDFKISNPIPQAIIDRAPTAELRENQTDESSLYPYEVLDGIAKRFIDYDQSEDEIISQGFDAEAVRRVIALIKGAEFKRKQTPIGPRLTRKNFGKGRRIPISLKW